MLIAQLQTNMIPKLLLLKLNAIININALKNPYPNRNDSHLYGFDLNTVAIKNQNDRFFVTHSKLDMNDLHTIFYIR